MLRLHNSYFLLLLVIFLASCVSPIAPRVSVSTPTLSSAARIYLTVALDDMQHSSLHRKAINWTLLRQQTFGAANGATTPADTYLAIRAALAALSDHHSFLLGPQDANQLSVTNLMPDQEPSGKRLTSDSGYLELPHFEASQQATQRYMLLAQNAIRTPDRLTVI